eukprot:2540299-Rhodomonas_salina.1
MRSYALSYRLLGPIRYLPTPYIPTAFNAMTSTESTPPYATPTTDCILHYAMSSTDIVPPYAIPSTDTAGCLYRLGDTQY